MHHQCRAARTRPEPECIDRLYRANNRVFASTAPNNNDKISRGLSGDLGGVLFLFFS